MVDVVIGVDVVEEFGYWTERTRTVLALDMEDDSLQHLHSDKTTVRIFERGLFFFVRLCSGWLCPFESMVVSMEGSMHGRMVWKDI